MSTTPKPDAIRLAEQLLDLASALRTTSNERGVINGAIQELRRLHAENTALSAECNKRVIALPQHLAEAWLKARDTRRASLAAAGVCPDCEGHGDIGGQFCGGTTEACSTCHGTGHATPPDQDDHV